MKTIKLKIENKRQYYITNLTQEACEKLIDKNSTTEGIRYRDKEGNPQIIYRKNVELLGSTKDASIYIIGRYIEYLKGYEAAFGKKQRKVQFRDYSRTEEEQLKNAHLVSTFEDAHSSANGILKMFKEPYIAIWYKKLL